MNDKTDDQIDAGFLFLNTTGRLHLSTAANERLIFVTKSLKGDTPIQGWPKQLVEQALSNLSSEGALAKKRTNWPVVVRVHYQPWVQEILEEVWDPSQRALGLLGECGSGKSPLGKSTLFAAVRYNKE